MTAVCASVRWCYGGRGHRGVTLAVWCLSGAPAFVAPGVALRTEPYPIANRNHVAESVADAGRVRLGAYAPSLPAGAP